MIESGHPSRTAGISLPEIATAQHNGATRDLVTTRLGASVVILIVAAYNILFFDRYFPLTEGWFSLYAQLIRHGDVPYRDFDFFLTPLYPLQLSAFTSVFGESVYALRVLGMFIIVGIASCEYRILLRFFPPFSAAFATISSVIYFQSGVAHITYDFTQVLTLYTLLSFYFLIRGIDTPKSNSKGRINARLILLLVCGFFSALAFLTKQSNGTLVVLGALLATCMARPFAEWRLTPVDLLAVSLGMIVPVAATCIWLASVGALLPCINQVFFGAIESKGHLDHIFFAWMPGFFNVTYLSQLKEMARILLPILIIQIIALLSFRCWPIVNIHGRALNALCLLVVFLVCAFAVIFPYYCAPAIAKYLGVGGPSLINYIIPISLSTSLLLLVIGMFQRLAISKNKITKNQLCASI